MLDKCTEAKDANVTAMSDVSDAVSDAEILKFGFWLSKKKLFYLLQWKLFKNDEKNAFYFIVKTPFVLKIFKFSFWLLVM